MNNETINEIATSILIILSFPIIYLISKNLMAFFKPSKLQQQQKERDANSCRIHEYTRIGNMRMCTECGYCAENKLYFNTDKIKIQLDLNKEIKKIEEEKDNKIDDIIGKHGVDRKLLEKITNEMSIAIADMEYQKQKKVESFMQIIKEQGLDREI